MHDNTWLTPTAISYLHELLTTRSYTNKEIFPRYVANLTRFKYHVSNPTPSAITQFLKRIKYIQSYDCPPETVKNEYMKFIMPLLDILPKYRDSCISGNVKHMMQTHEIHAFSYPETIEEHTKMRYIVVNQHNTNVIVFAYSEATLLLLSTAFTGRMQLDVGSHGITRVEQIEGTIGIHIINGDQLETLLDREKATEAKDHAIKRKEELAAQLQNITERIG